MLVCIDDLHGYACCPAKSGDFICNARAHSIAARRLSSTFSALIEVKNFFHVGPPLILPASFKRTLHRHHDCPPLLCFWIGSHCCHVRWIICAVIFEVAEEQAVL